MRYAVNHEFFHNLQKERNIDSADIGLPSAEEKVKRMLADVERTLTEIQKDRVAMLQIIDSDIKRRSLPRTPEQQEKPLPRRIANV